MKKIVSTILACAMGMSVFSLAACTEDNGDGGNTPVNIIRLRGETDKSLQVGDIYKIVYDTKYNGELIQNGATFKSENESVVTVDDYGNVSAVGVGKADVIVTHKHDSSVKAIVSFDVTKTFFMFKPGYSAGDVDPATADTDGWVHIKAGQQTQLLVSECSENWYFKTSVEHTGDTGADSNGRWGVGSFVVDDTHPIGQVMAWFGFKPTNHATKLYTPYVGGWRVQSGGNDPEIEISEAMENAGNAEFEIIRNGIDLYCKITVGNKVAKYIYSCPSLEGIATYPGVYSQRQELYITDFEATSDLAEVQQKLNNFQKAESVTIHGISDKLFAGGEYNLVATVSPDTTYDKGIKFSLKEEVAGVTLTNSGKLTIASSASGSVTVVATADSDASVSAERTYAIAAETSSEHAVVDTTNTVKTGTAEYVLGTDSVTYSGTGNTYLPLAAKSTKWAVEFTTLLTAGRAGVLSAADGYCDYLSIAIGNGAAEYGAMTGKVTSVACNTAASDAVKIIRDGSFYLVIVNGRLVNRFYQATSGDTMPVIFTEGAAGAINDIILTTDSADVDAIAANYPHTVGKYVTDNGNGSYTLAAMNFTGEVNDINWPPVNNYENGLKFAKTLTGNYTIEFTMSDINPLSYGGETDSKVLIYLRSETKTSSLQFCFKSKNGSIATSFCPNLDDATWDEYPVDVELLGNEVTVKVVKTAEKVEVYLNGVLAFEGNSGLVNNGHWNSETVCTPGIGTFRCGVTVSGISLTVGND